ncbi:MAG: exopolysaccharide biosynthesis protein [Verrucomicrobia bacterium]|nr:exopolysaccharide biosynthesis protein [Verrucomicrobiota bacterium]
MATNGAPDPANGTLVVVAARPRKLSEEMDRLIAEFHMRSVSLREVIVVLQGRAYNLLMLLLAVPFLLPVPIPGLSIVLGLVIAIIAARLTLGQRPWLPARLLDRKLPPKFFPTLLGGARRLLRCFEVMLKPRLLWLTAPPFLPQLHAFIIFVAASVLLLPLPPGTNFPPALCIVIMAGGLLERDGLFILGGYVAFALNGVFFALFAIYGEKLLHALWQWIAG